MLQVFWLYEIDFEAYSRLALDYKLVRLALDYKLVRDIWKVRNKQPGTRIEGDSSFLALFMKLV